MDEFKECEESFKKEQEYLHREDIVSEEICLKFLNDHVKPVIEHPDTQKFLDEKTGRTVYVNVESKKIVEAEDTSQPKVKDYATSYPTNEKHLELLERQRKITLPKKELEELQKSRYLFLVEQEKNLKQKGERLSSSDSRELFDYRCFLVTQIAYNQRFDYLSLFENYVTGKIPLYHFYFEFNTLYQELNRINMDVDQLSNFTMEFGIASKMGQFTDLIIDLWYHYEHVFREEGERSVWESNYEANFESSINLIHTKYQEIKKCLE